MPATQPDAIPTADASAEFRDVALPHLAAVARLARALVRDPADADDLVQETFLKAFRYWPSFRPGSDCLRWLSAICRNLARDQYRRAVEERVETVEDVDDWSAARPHAAARDAGLEQLYERIDLGPAIRTAIDALPSVFREVVILSDVEGLSYQDIALNLDVPVGTVRSRLYRARRMLQERLHDYAVDAGFGASAGRDEAA